MSESAEERIRCIVYRWKESLGGGYPVEAFITELQAEIRAAESAAEQRERDYWFDTVHEEAGRFGFDRSGLAGAALVRELALMLDATTKKLESAEFAKFAEGIRIGQERMRERAEAGIEMANFSIFPEPPIRTDPAYAQGWEDRKAIDKAAIRALEVEDE